MSSSIFDDLKSYADFNSDDARLLKEAHRKIRDRFPAIAEDFYRRILQHEGTRRILEDSGQVERLKKTLLTWLEEVFQGPHDRSYFEKRNRIGATHVQVGLPQEYVFIAMAHIHHQLEAAMVEELQTDAASLGKTLSALARILAIDQAVIAGAYHDAEKYRDLVEFAPEMIHQVDREGRIVRINRTEEQRLGYPQNQLIGKRMEEFVLEEDRPAFREHLRRVFSAGESRCEVRLLTAAGEKIDVEILATGSRDPITGEVVLSRAYVRDITERKRLAKKLVEQASLARMGEMAAVVAHEVKNPLAGIAGAIQVIGSRMPAGSADLPVIQEIISRIEALNAAVNDMLLFARPRLPESAPVPVLSLLRDTTALFRRDPDFLEVEVEFSGEDLIIAGDAELLKPVFLNLLVNAGQAMKGAGRVSVSVQSSDSRCRIAISDIGPGIPPEIRERVFEAFFSTKHRGTGLGLSIARRIVEAHGGEIAVECPPGGGTTVLLHLPLTGKEGTV